MIVVDVLEAIFAVVFNGDGTHWRDGTEKFVMGGGLYELVIHGCESRSRVVEIVDAVRGLVDEIDGIIKTFRIIGAIATNGEQWLVVRSLVRYFICIFSWHR